MKVQNKPQIPAWLRNVYGRCPEMLPRGLQSETVSVTDASMRVTSEPVSAYCAVPPWAVAQSNGYAFRAEDISGSDASSRSSTLRTNEDLLSPGRRLDRPRVQSLEAGTTVEVYAYGPLPANADTVAPEHMTTSLGVTGDKRVLLRRPLSRGANVVEKASEYKAGDLLLEKGQRITPERLAMLLAAGVREVKVSKRPRIGVVVSSYERCEPFGSRDCWQPPDACGIYIQTLLQRWGFEVQPVEFLPPPAQAGLPLQARRDEERLFQGRVKALAQQYDLIIGSGMSSVGWHRELGLNQLSWFDGNLHNDVNTLNQAPGSRFNFAKSADRSPPHTEVFNFIDAHGIPRGSRSVLHRDQATLINLPGFLSSVAVLMHVVVRRVLDLYEFVEMPGPHWEIGELAREVQCDSEINQMQWAKIVWGPRGEPLIDPLPDQAPHRIGAFLDAEVIAAIPACPGRLAAASRIHFLRLDPMRQPAVPNCALAEPIPIVTGANHSTQSSMESESMEQPQLDVAQSWAHLEAWLQAQPRAIPGGFNAGASDDDIQILEGALGATLPEDFVESLKRHNGQADQGGVCFDGESLLDIQGILSEWTTWRELVVEGAFDGMTSDPDAGVKDDWYNLKWIPLTRNGMGDGLCIDLDPAPGGTVGQVIRMLHDDDQRERVAASFTQWLSGHVVATIGLEEREK